MIRIETVVMTAPLAETIAGIINRSFSIEEWFVDGNRIDPETVMALATADNGQFLVAYVEGRRPIGSIYAEVRDQGRGYFGLLAVEPDCRGRGVGHELMRGAEDDLRRQGCRAVEITVVDLRRELFPYYERRGYRTDGRSLPFPRAAKQPCILIYMSKELN